MHNQITPSQIYNNIRYDEGTNSDLNDFLDLCDFRSATLEALFGFRQFADGNLRHALGLLVGNSMEYDDPNRTEDSSAIEAHRHLCFMKLAGENLANRTLDMLRNAGVVGDTDVPDPNSYTNDSLWKWLESQGAKRDALEEHLESALSQKELFGLMRMTRLSGESASLPSPAIQARPPSPIPAGIQEARRKEQEKEETRILIDNRMLRAPDDSEIPAIPERKNAEAALQKLFGIPRRDRTRRQIFDAGVLPFGIDLYYFEDYASDDYLRKWSDTSPRERSKIFSDLLMQQLNSDQLPQKMTPNKIWQNMGHPECRLRVTRGVKGGHCGSHSSTFPLLHKLYRFSGGNFPTALGQLVRNYRELIDPNAIIESQNIANMQWAFMRLVGMPEGERDDEELRRTGLVDGSETKQQKEYVKSDAFLRKWLQGGKCVALATGAATNPVLTPIDPRQPQ